MTAHDLEELDLDEEIALDQLTDAPREDAAARAARDFLAALGVQLDTPGTARTAERMVRAYQALLAAPPFELTAFANDGGYDELVLVRDIPVHSVCEHHFLPFSGVAHVAYLPGERLVGLSKLARVVEHLARRPQVQERLTRQVAEWLDTSLHPRGVGVVVEAEHSCMTLRGVRALGSRTRTQAFTGELRDGPARAELLGAVGEPR